MELNKAFYSPAEVAKMIDVHPTTILNYIRDEKLYAIRLSERTIRIPARSVLKLLAPEVGAPRHIERPHDDVRKAVTTPEHTSSDNRVPA